MADTTTKPRLLTFAISHYCEKARWALDITANPYQEEMHAPGVHRVYTGSYGSSSVPVFVLPDGKGLTQSSDMVAWASENSKNGVKLYGTNDEEKKQILELEASFGDKLAPCTRRLLFFNIVEKTVVIPLITEGVPGWESTSVYMGFFAMKQVMKSGMELTEEKAKEAERVITEVFDEVSKMVSDGRKFLVGNSLSAADISFATLASPVLLPPEFKSVAKHEAKFPANHLELVKKFRETPAGQFALRLFKEERFPKQNQ